MNSSGRTIKVAHIVYSLSIGGVTNIVNQLTEGRNKDYEAILILLCREEVQQVALPEGVRSFQLDYTPPANSGLPSLVKEFFFPAQYFGRIAKDIGKIFLEERFDIFHFHGLPRDLGIGKLVNREYGAVQLVYTDHLLRISKEEYGRLQGKILKWLYRNGYKLYNTVFVSRQAYEWARQIRMINEKKLNTCIENSVELSLFMQKPDYEIKKAPRIVYVSRIAAVKGHFLLLPVARILREKFKRTEFQFVLIGPGELTEILKDEVRKNGLMEHFVFEGPRQDVPSLLPGYDLAVFPSEREGLPVALLEKMATGLPVIASDIPEIKNVIQHTDEGLLFPVNNAEACAAQINKLISDRALREKMGRTARKAVEERYAQPLLEKYIGFYKQVLEN